MFFFSESCPIDLKANYLQKKLNFADKFQIYFCDESDFFSFESIVGTQSGFSVFSQPTGGLELYQAIEPTMTAIAKPIPNMPKKDH